jgi:hypothetical protein
MVPDRGGGAVVEGLAFAPRSIQWFAAISMVQLRRRESGCCYPQMSSTDATLVDCNGLGKAKEAIRLCLCLCTSSSEALRKLDVAERSA